MSPIISIAIFVVSAVVGYFLIKHVPSLLHTPLMSGMNALSGITLLGAIIAVTSAVHTGSVIVAYIAVFLAMVNIAAGFSVTHRMLRMFNRNKSSGGAQHKESRGDN
ncbi:MAG: NAD(P) transhydrogenase subunit alpha [Oscillospiraceae bacterium]|nr:NAD(P) transhydrogenase subunit alpha [Oscillospiraceae bacterium]